jgi:hypothetical protein
MAMSRVDQLKCDRCGETKGWEEARRDKWGSVRVWLGERCKADGSLIPPRLEADLCVACAGKVLAAIEKPRDAVQVG